MEIHTLLAVVILGCLLGQYEAATCASGKSHFRVCNRNGFTSSSGRMSYDTIETNEGCGSSGDLSAGEYTAPVDGEYFFSMNVHGNDYKVKMYYMKPGAGAECLEVVQAPASTGRADSRSASTIVRLGAGDKVWIEVRESNGMACAYYEPCTFSGYLMN